MKRYLIVCCLILGLYNVAYRNDILCRISLYLNDIRDRYSFILFRCYLDYWSLMMGSLSHYFIILLLGSSLLVFYKMRDKYYYINMIFLIHFIILPFAFIYFNPISIMVPEHELRIVTFKSDQEYESEICNAMKFYIVIRSSKDTYTYLAFITDIEVETLRQKSLWISDWKY